ncbi:hypothetical protein LOK49_LG08G01295 [Camellia lanceoleosa]|uniref:Uncharacterized protein n=1 Tax=Camellia lanceoleosa TaxID=1840588 RepID=A0ACC0GVT3_9ERIC|nr:hypothetical protein LOK49_LG08G01295 [Camellia lanceoleosa]
MNISLTLTRSIPKSTENTLFQFPRLKQVRNLTLVRLGDSARDAQFFAGEEEEEEQVVKEPSFFDFVSSERMKVVAMIALALALCNADRVVMSVAIVPLSLVNGWRQSFAGVVQVSSTVWFIDL